MIEQQSQSGSGGRATVLTIQSVEPDPDWPDSKAESMKRICIFMTSIAFALLCGCATVYEDNYAFDAGWRKGWIERIGLAPGLRPLDERDCRQGASGATPSSRTYATVRYFSGRWPRERWVPISSDAALKVGDPVYANILQCVAPVVRSPSTDLFPDSLFPRRRQSS